MDAKWLKDAWGGTIKLVKRDKKRDHQTGWTQFDYHELVSAGPDGKFGTEDDVKWLNPNQWFLAQLWWIGSETRQAQLSQGFGKGRDFARGGLRRNRRFGGVEGVADLAMRLAGAPGELPEKAAKADGKARETDAGGGKAPGEGGGAAPVRVREYFPETMLWYPALITDDRGQAILPVTFADSITTWRLSASASSKGGALGGVSAPLRVFQDFFVDLDLPIALTQNDEVAFPVAVYNYLKKPQTVKLQLQKEPWFDLTDDRGPTRSLDLKPNEVTAVKFRIKARRIGYQPLTVKATGSSMSDAIKRTIEIVPDGQKVERVVTDRLTGKVAQTIDIPENAVPDSYKLLVKIYPGVFSQVMEGTEGMLRLPGG